MVLFAKRDGESLRTVDQDALWSSSAISRLPASPSLIGNGSGLYGLQESLLFLVTTEATSVRMDALRWLSEFSRLSPTVRVSMRQIAANEGEPLAKRVAALGVLMRQPQPDDVKIVAGLAVRHGTELADPAYASVTRLVGLPGDPQMLDSLVTIATASGTPQRWRSSALGALRRLRTPAAIPAFILSLDNPDENVQHGAVMALAELMGKGGEEYGPGAAAFSRNPGYATEHWKAWWRDEGKHFYEARMQPGSEKSINQRK